MTGRASSLMSKWAANLAIAFVLLACPVAAAAGDAQAGLGLAGKWCNSCHSIGNEEPRQEDAGPLFTELAKNDSAYLLVAINRPHDFMPNFPRLSDTDKEDLIAYIQSLK